MFSVGDKVVYPMHGAGIVQAIEQHELAGEAVDYLVMVMLLTDMRVMVPLKNVERVGLRHIISKDEIPGIEKVLGKSTVPGFASIDASHGFCHQPYFFKASVISFIASAAKRLGVPPPK